MLIDVPKNYKCTRGKLTDPIRYLTGKDGNSFPQWKKFPFKFPLLDHCETFIDRTTRERIFVSHPHVEDLDLVSQMRMVLDSCGIDVVWYKDSWYHEGACRLELRNAAIRKCIVNGQGSQVLKQGHRSVLVG